MPTLMTEEEAEPSKHVGSARKGKAVEHLIAASCILASEGELNASTSLVDDEGVDIVFHQRGSSRTLAVQVKSRFDEEGGSTHLFEKGTFIGDVRLVNFKARDNFFLLFVAVRSKDANFGPVWWVPSHKFEAGDGGRAGRQSITPVLGFGQAGEQRQVAEVSTRHEGPNGGEDPRGATENLRRAPCGHRSAQACLERWDTLSATTFSSTRSESWGTTYSGTPT